MFRQVLAVLPFALTPTLALSQESSYEFNNTNCTGFYSNDTNASYANWINQNYFDTNPSPNDTDVSYTYEMDKSEEAKSAAQQVESIWTKILQTRYNEIPPYADYGLKKAQLLFSSCAEKAFTHIGDEMIPGRKKLIHSSGSVIRIAWKATNTHPYTGLFESGTDNALLRVSLAKPAEEKNIVPGIAIKLFADGQESVNIFAMNSLDGQESQNVFEKPFTNALRAPQSSFMNNLLQHSFSQALKNIGSQGSPLVLTTEHIAAITANGTVIDKMKVKAPLQLIFVPSDELSELTENIQFGTDFRTVIEGKGEGMILYYIYGKDNMHESAMYLGTLEALNNFTASSYGDEVLYFQHQKT